MSVSRDHRLSLFDVVALRREFPILQHAQAGRALAFLDSASSSQKPRRVIDAHADFYRQTNANVHRGVYRLSEEATFAFERARGKLARFIGAASPREVIFTRNATEAINLVARSWGETHLRAGDAIVLSAMEHHSNLVPWQMVAQRTGARLRFLPVDGAGRLDLADLDRVLADGARIVALTHQSNVLGTINPIALIAARAHAAGALVLVDGAQSVPHMPVDVQALGIDFLAFSGHKMCGPTGIGVLWGRRAILEAMPPFLGGGSMIRTVGLEQSTYADLPARFEAGTPAIAEAIALGEAADFLGEVGMDAIAAYEHQLAAQALERLRDVAGLQLIGPADAHDRGAIFAFTLDGVHPHDVAQILDGDGIAVRAGHHCCQPLHAQFGIPATTRASFYLYSLPEEIDRLVAALIRARAMFT
jgi:cysteine desulfurase/selenocysteine lyase